MSIATITVYGVFVSSTLWAPGAFRMRVADLCWLGGDASVHNGSKDGVLILITIERAHVETMYLGSQGGKEVHRHQIIQCPLKCRVLVAIFALDFLTQRMESEIKDIT